jgi:50S ribosomal subunit-associated GTPase HflX
MIRKSGGKTTAFLVGIHGADIQPHDAKEHLDELRELVGTLGIGDAGNMLVNLRQPNPKFYIVQARLSR